MSRRRPVAVTFTLGLVALGACGADRPDYHTASAVADALNHGDITCVFAPTAPASSLPEVESAGVCRGVGYVVDIFVFRDADARKQMQADAEAHWCREGVTEGSYVAAGGWLVTLDPGPTDGSLYMNDLAEATGGERFRLTATSCLPTRMVGHCYGTRTRASAVTN